MLSSGIIVSIIGYPLFQNFVPWRIIYFTNAGLMITLTVIFYFFSVESLRVTISKNNFGELKNNIRYIMKVNGLSQEEYDSLIKHITEDAKIEAVEETTGKYDALIDEKDVVITKTKETNVVHHEEGSKDAICNVVLKESSDDLVPIENKENVVWTFAKLIVAFALYIVLINMTIFEIKNYGTDITTGIFIAFTAGSAPLYMFASYLMNLKSLGRRYAIIYPFIIICIIKLISIFTNKSLEKYFYMIYRTLMFSTQAIFHALVNESFATKDRITYYGRIFLASKICSLASAFLLEYLSNTVLSIVILSFLTIIAVITYMLKETNHVNIE